MNIAAAGWSSAIAMQIAWSEKIEFENVFECRELFEGIFSVLYDG